MALLKALRLWETIESEDNPPPLGPNPTVAQMKIYEDVKSKKPKDLTCLCRAPFFYKTGSCKTSWDNSFGVQKELSD